MSNISYIFDIEQAAEAMSYLLSLNDGTMNYMKAIKILYLSDRESFSHGHNSITTDCYKSLKHGPITSEIYDCIMGKHEGNEYWNTYIKREGYNISKICDIEYQKLSIADRETIERIDARFKDYSQWDMRDYTHTLGEWEDPGESSIPITIETIIASSVDSNKAKAIMEELAIGAHAQKVNYRTEKSVRQ